MRPFLFFVAGLCVQADANVDGNSLAYAEMRVLLARIIWNFDLEVAQDSKMWLEEMKVWSLYKKGPLNVYFKPRKV